MQIYFVKYSTDYSCFLIRYLLYIYLFLYASDFDKFTRRPILYPYLKIMSVVVLRFRNLCMAYTRVSLNFISQSIVHKRKKYLKSETKLRQMWNCWVDFSWVKQSGSFFTYCIGWEHNHDCFVVWINICCNVLLEPLLDMI